MGWFGVIKIDKIT